MTLKETDMINRYVLLGSVSAVAAGLLTAMALTLDSHAAQKTAAADAVHCLLDPTPRQEAITEESARTMAPEKLDTAVSRRIEVLKTVGLSDEQRERIERIQDAHARRDAQIAQAIAAELARPGAASSAPDVVAKLQREQAEVDFMVLNHVHDVLDADQRLRLQMGCREQSAQSALGAGALRTS
jgi:hypothetical protein